MADEQQVESGEAEQQVEADQVEQQTEQQQTEQQQQVEAGEEGEQQAASEQQQQEQKPGTDWRDRRIAKLTAQLRAEQQKNAGAQSQPSGESPLPDENARVEARAAQLAAQREFDRACDSAAQTGVAKFGQEFNASVSNLGNLVDRNDPGDVQRYNTFIQAALETGLAPDIIHRLGRDANEADRIMSLPPIRMAVEMTKLAQTLAQGGRTAGEISAAPAPLTPVGHRVGPKNIDPRDKDNSDRLSTRDWIDRREAQVAAARRAG